MKRNLFVIPVMIGFLAVLVIPAAAELSSTNYRITTTVISDGGGSMGSSNFQIDGTVGQSSPLMDSTNIPYSTSYDLYPGFWYTLASGPLLCGELSNFALAFGTTSADSNYNIACDSEPDGDIDGFDVADFLQGY